MDKKKSKKPVTKKAEPPVEEAAKKAEQWEAELAWEPQSIGKLTARQRQFVREYLLTRNATESARRAGYAKKHADVIGPRLLGNVGIQEAIERGERRVEKEFEVTQDKIVRELAAVAFGNLGMVVTKNGNDIYIEEPEDARFISGYSKSISAEGESFSVQGHNKVKALELLGKHIGMWKGGKDDPRDEAAHRAAQLAIINRVSKVLREFNGGGGSSSGSEGSGSDGP